MSRTFTNRTRGAQTTRPPQRMNPTRGMPEESPTGAANDVPPTCREPCPGAGYTVFRPDEGRRQAIQRQADEETRRVEEHRAANRPHYAIVETLGGGDMTSGASATAVTQRRLPAQGSNLTSRQKSEMYRQEKKLREEQEFEKKKQIARQKAIENENRDKERAERFKSDERSSRAAFLDKLEGKSSGNAQGKPANALSASGPTASASGGVKEGTENPEFVDGLVQLESMFPWVDKDVLKTLLRESGNNVDDVVQYLS